jgi:predicted enzyme related to lactoylglutathione lyase
MTISSALTAMAPVFISAAEARRGGASVWVGVEDAEKLHQELESQGVPIRMPPSNYPRALEFHVEDPDGNVLRFGSEPA